MEEKRNGLDYMPWGGHRDEYIHSLPSSYLRWVAENADWDTRIQELCDEEWQFREKNNCHKED